jgi:hypothetical protein
VGIPGFYCVGGIFREDNSSLFRFHRRFLEGGTITSIKKQNSVSKRGKKKREKGGKKRRNKVLFGNCTSHVELRGGDNKRQEAELRQQEHQKKREKEGKNRRDNLLLGHRIRTEGRFAHLPKREKRQSGRRKERGRIGVLSSLQ